MGNTETQAYPLIVREPDDTVKVIAPMVLANGRVIYPQERSIETQLAAYLEEQGEQ